MSWGKAAEKPSSSRGSLSKETQSLIDGFIAQKGLSKRAADEVREAASSGDSDWVNTLQRGVSMQKPSSHVSTSQRPKLAVPRVGRGSSHAPSPPPVGSFSGKRLETQIRQAIPRDREQYVSKGPGPNREKEKDKLSRRFEMGREAAMVVEAKEAELEIRARRGGPPETTARTERPEDSAREQLIDQILDEIDERRAFLEDMRAKGMSQRYEGQIKGEIAERMGQLRRMGVTGC